MISTQCPPVTRRDMVNARYEALFVSGLQRSDALTADVVAEAIGRTLRRFGPRGCAGLMAQEFGDHPEAAGERMRWVRQVVTQVPGWCAA